MQTAALQGGADQVPGILGAERQGLNHSHRVCQEDQQNDVRK